MSIRRKTACLIVEIVGDGVPTWQSGPLPWQPAPIKEPESIHRAVTTDRYTSEARRVYFEDRVSDVLYGDSFDSCKRLHVLLEAEINDVQVFGAEYILLPEIVASHRSLLVLHLTLGDSPIMDLSEVANLRRSASGESATLIFIKELLPAGSMIAERQPRAQSIAHVTFTDRPSESMPSAYKGWEPLEQWLWQLAAAPYESFPPDPGDRSAFIGLIPFSRDWRALILRDGAAFVGSTPDDGLKTCFHAQAEIYVHTIYLDVLMLGRIQRIALSQLGSTITAAHTSDLSSWTAENLEFRLARLRVSFWTTHLSFHTRANDLIRAYQNQNGIDDLTSRILVDLESFSRLISAVSTRRLNAVLGLVSIIGFPLTTAFAAGQIWTAASPMTVAIWALAAVIVAIAILVLSPTIRSLVTSSRSTPLRIRRHKTRRQNSRNHWTPTETTSKP